MSARDAETTSRLCQLQPVNAADSGRHSLQQKVNLTSLLLDFAFHEQKKNKCRARLKCED